MDEGKSARLTQWEQITQSNELSNYQRFFIVLPVVVCVALSGRDATLRSVVAARWRRGCRRPTRVRRAHIVLVCHRCCQVLPLGGLHAPRQHLLCHQPCLFGVGRRAKDPRLLRGTWRPGGGTRGRTWSRSVSQAGRRRAWRARAVSRLLRAAAQCPSAQLALSVLTGARLWHQPLLRGSACRLVLLHVCSARVYLIDLLTNVCLRCCRFRLASSAAYTQKGNQGRGAGERVACDVRQVRQGQQIGGSGGGEEGPSFSRSRCSRSVWLRARAALVHAGEAATVFLGWLRQARRYWREASRRQGKDRNRLIHNLSSSSRTQCVSLCVVISVSSRVCILLQ